MKPNGSNDLGCIQKYAYFNILINYINDKIINYWHNNFYNTFHA